MKTRRGVPRSEETKKKISKTLMGHRLSKKARESLRIHSPFKKGFTPWNKGRHWSEEMKKRISETNKRLGIEPKIKNKFPCGDKHPNWNGGTSFEPYSIDWTKTLKISIRERDHYTCQLCKEKQGDETFLIHHIDYDKKNCNPNNLITLCRACHAKTNHNRQYWIKKWNL